MVAIDQDRISTPEGCAEALAESEVELARGKRVSSQSVHDALRAALAEMESEPAEGGVAPVSSSTPR
jgi:hypothetical protein